MSARPAHVRPPSVTMARVRPGVHRRFTPTSLNRRCHRCRPVGTRSGLPSSQPPAPPVRVLSANAPLAPVSLALLAPAAQAARASPAVDLSTYTVVGRYSLLSTVGHLRTRPACWRRSPRRGPTTGTPAPSSWSVTAVLGRPGHHDPHLIDSMILAPGSSPKARSSTTNHML